MATHPGWYYCHEGHRFGPVSSRTLRNLAAISQLDPSDLVWQKGLPDWISAKQVRGLFPEPVGRMPPSSRPRPSPG